MYLIGGFRTTSSAITPVGMTQFDPRTMKSRFIPVTGFVVGGHSHYRVAPSCVFVKAGNKIYCFGGYTNDGSGNYDDIFYIDLTPVNQI